MTERNETPTDKPMTQSAAPCSEPNCIDMALAVLRSHPAATWRDEFSGLATDDLVIDRDMARHFADEASTLRAENERLRSTIATLTAEREPRDIDDEMGKRTVRWGLDDPALDGTDAAHPAWWRGNDDGVKAVVKIVTGLLDGVPHVGTFGNADLELVAKRIALLVAAKDAAIGSRDLTIRALTLQLREAREERFRLAAELAETSVARDAALAELATLRDQVDTIPPPKTPRHEEEQVSNWIGKKNLIGRTITAVELSQDRETLTLVCADGSTITGITDGDCCSQTWVENVENEEALIGHTITAIEDIEMPDLGDIGTPHHPDVDSVQYYGLRITTTGGICTIDYRNDSNGYYGGSIVWRASEGE